MGSVLYSHLSFKQHYCSSVMNYYKLSHNIPNQCMINVGYYLANMKDVVGLGCIKCVGDVALSGSVKEM